MRRAAWVIGYLTCTLAVLNGEALPVRIFTTSDGLANNTIDRIVEDSRGFLWFCTRERVSPLTNYKKMAGAGAALGTIVFVGMLPVSSPRGLAQGVDNDDSRVALGFAIAPVPLNLTGKDRNLVGLGSYWVNAIGDCNGCHTSGAPPNFNYLAGHNPYFLFQGPTKTDPAAYLGGGAGIGTALPFNVPPGLGYGSYTGPQIVARNLTPDRTGLPEGGHTLAQFMDIIRTGVDMDHLHPTCTTNTPSPSPQNCIPPPVDGSRLQVMPWPVFANLSDNDLRAIWTYLSAIPCIAGPPAPSVLHNNCR